MAVRAPITGAHTRAPSDPLPFPDLTPIEDAYAVILSVDGALGILAAAIEDVPGIGTDAPHAAYAAGYALDHAQRLLRNGIDALTAYQAALTKMA